MSNNKNEVTWLDSYEMATPRAKTAAIFFALAKLFFLFTCLSLFVGGLVLYLNLTIYILLVVMSAGLCIYDFSQQGVKKDVG
tara:strand:+ start:230 stop:475 length:246 start_codon:yes stop_codon:yes gene_type:complete